MTGNMNLFDTWGAILGPFATGMIYDRTESYALVFSGSPWRCLFAPCSLRC